MSAQRPKADVKKLVVASVSRPGNLGVLGVGTLGSVGLIAAGLPIVGAAVLGLGALAYGALVGYDLFNPRFIKKVYGLEDAGDRPALPAPGERTVEPKAIEAPDLRDVYEAILANAATIRTAIDGSPDMLVASLQDTYRRCEVLVTEAGHIGVRGNRLYRYLTAIKPVAIEREAKELEDQADRARDAKAAATYRQAAESKRQQHATHQQMDGLYDRIRAQLSAIETVLDGIHAKVIKLNATDIEETASVTASISDHIDALSTDIQVLEATVDETLEELSL